MVFLAAPLLFGVSSSILSSLMSKICLLALGAINVKKTSLKLRNMLKKTKVFAWANSTERHSSSSVLKTTVGSHLIKLINRDGALNARKLSKTSSSSISKTKKPKSRLNTKRTRKKCTEKLVAKLWFLNLVMKLTQPLKNTKRRSSWLQSKLREKLKK